MNDAEYATEKEAAENALMVERMRGCICEPEITVTPVEDKPGMFDATIAHDPWCAIFASNN